ncbi:hypothetical protein QR680_015509 [Steinernema hermaphroditum]|uniref:TIL domain-containing protein n=1 Tax=Steinernema hermaphroditum TaxID=289476 RepID=A0AA39H7X4_9BILA|nr:hypothetical protein QR680_015509 [Steinernema hermaphroditum]
MVDLKVISLVFLVSTGFAHPRCGSEMTTETPTPVTSHPSSFPPGCYERCMPPSCGDWCFTNASGQKGTCYIETICAGTATPPTPPVIESPTPIV